MKKFKQYLTPKTAKLSFKEKALLDAKKTIEEKAELEKQLKLQEEAEREKSIVWKIKDEKTIIQENIGEEPIEEFIEQPVIEEPVVEQVRNMAEKMGLTAQQISQKTGIPEQDIKNMALTASFALPQAIKEVAPVAKQAAGAARRTEAVFRRRARATQNGGAGAERRSEPAVLGLPTGAEKHPDSRYRRKPGLRPCVRRRPEQEHI